MFAAIGVFLALFAINFSGVESYFLRHPSTLDVRSVRMWVTEGVAPLACAFALWMIALGLGLRAAGRLGVSLKGRLGSTVAAALGLGLMAQAVFALGLLGGLNVVGFSLLILAAAAIAIPALPRPVAIAPPALSAVRGVLAGALAYALFCALITALAPPIEWDVLAYHLALPEIYLKSGQIVDIPWMIHSHWPHLMETFYSLPMAFGSDAVPALIHLGAAFLFVSSAAVAGTGAGGWVAAILLAGQPALLRLAGCAHGDAASALFVLSGAWALSRWEETRRDGWLAIAGLLTGFAASAKLLGVAALGAWTIAACLKSRGWRAGACFAGAALLALAPWLARTWWATGDPLWPFLRNSPEAAALAIRYLRSNRWDFPPSWSVLTHDGPGYLLLPVIGLFVLSRGRRPKPTSVESWLWTTAPAYAFLVWRHNEAWRFLMPVWPAAALAASRSAVGAFSGGRLRALVAAAFVFASAVPIARSSSNNEMFAVLGLRSLSSPWAPPRVLFTGKCVDVARFYRKTRDVIAPGSKVLLFREVRGYGSGFDYQWGDPMNQALVDYARIATPDDLARRLKSLGITHVLNHHGSRLYQADPGYYNGRILGLMDDCLRTRSRQVAADEGISLHELF